MRGSVVRWSPEELSGWVTLDENGCWIWQGNISPITQKAAKHTGVVQMISPHEYLRCVGDSYTQVRDVQGRLLGCIPRIADNVEGIRASDGTPYPVRIAAVACLCVPDDVDPRTLPQFTPLDLGRNADLALPPRVEP